MEESAANATAKSVCVFESQAENEKLIFLRRSHVITNLPWVLITVFLALVPMALIWLNPIDQLGLNFAISQKSLIGFILFWYLLVYAFALQHFLSWYFNVYILTDSRLVDVDFFQMIYKRVSSANLDKVEDVTITTGGIAQILFHYGDVHMQTAGTVVNFEFLKVANPGEVKKAIESAIVDYKGKS